MNIAIIADFTTEHIRGGMEKHIEDISRELSKKNKVIIITSKYKNFSKRKVNNVIHYYYKERIRRFYSSPFFLKRFAIFVNNILKKEKIDIVNIQSNISYGYKELSLDLPIILTMHGTEINEVKSAFSGSIIRGILMAIKASHTYILTKRIISNSKYIICVSDELKKDIIKQYGVNKDKISVIYNGINLNKFKPTKRKERKKINLFSIANISRQKGYFFLVDCIGELIKHNKNVKLTIAGTGKDYISLKRYIEKKGLKDIISLIGKISDRDLLYYYKHSDIFVFPTLRYEGLPYTIIEAMACGLPVISTNIGGIPSAIINGKNGFLIKKGNKEEFLKYLIYLINNEKLRIKMGKEGRKIAKDRFDIKKMVKEYEKIFEKIKKNKKP